VLSAEFLRKTHIQAPGKEEEVRTQDPSVKIFWKTPLAFSVPADAQSLRDTIVCQGSVVHRSETANIKQQQENLHKVSWSFLHSLTSHPNLPFYCNIIPNTSSVNVLWTTETSEQTKNNFLVRGMPVQSISGYNISGETIQFFGHQRLRISHVAHNISCETWRTIAS